MADEMNTERDMPEGITRDDTVHGQTYYTASDYAKARNQGFRDGVASLSAPLQSALDVIERWARDAYVVCGKPSTQEGFEAAWKAEDADAYAVWVAGRASLAANAPAATAADGKWYMLSRDGMATLCADRDDAMTEAASADKLYPNGAPHRALQLVAANAGSPEINGQLYTALNNLFTHLGMEGCITADHAFVWDAMTALKRIDGGVHLDNLAVPVDPDAHRDDMLAAVQLLEGGEWAEHFAKTPIGMRLEDQITKLHNEVAANAGGEPVAWMDAERGEVVSAKWLASDEATSDYRAVYTTPLYTHTSPPEGMVMVPRKASVAIICAIEGEVDSQLTASAMEPGLMHRQDGSDIWDAAIAAAPPLASEAGEAT